MERRAQSLHGSASVPEPPPRPSRNSMIPEGALAGLHLGGQPQTSPTLSSGGSRTLMGETLPSARRGFLRKSSAIEEAGAPAPPPRASMLVQEDLDKGYVEANPAMFARGFSSRSGSTSAPSPSPATTTTAAAPVVSASLPSASGTLQRPGGTLPRPSVSGTLKPYAEDDDHAYEYQDTLAAAGAATGAEAGAKKGLKALSKQITFDLEDSSCIGEPWYHGNLSRVDAEELLKKSNLEEGLFLVRNSSHGTASLAISVCHGGKVLHHRLEMTPDRQYMFVGNVLRFRSLALLIDFYVKTPDEEKYRLKRYLNVRAS